MDLLREVEHLLCRVVAVGKEGALRQGRNPVFIPEEIEEVGVEGGFEVRDFERVVPEELLVSLRQNQRSEGLTGYYALQNPQSYLME